MKLVHSDEMKKDFLSPTRLTSWLIFGWHNRKTLSLQWPQRKTCSRFFTAGTDKDYNVIIKPDTGHNHDDKRDGH